MVIEAVAAEPEPEQANKVAVEDLLPEFTMADEAPERSLAAGMGQYEFVGRKALVVEGVCFQVAYKVWLESFGMYPLPMVKRVKQFWTSMKTWLSENFPEAYRTLCKGVSEAQLKSAEDDLGFKLPMPTKLLYRFCNAQLPFSEDHDANKSISTHGLIGGYAFYDHWVNVHLSPLEQIVEETKDFYREFHDVFHGRKFIVVATSWFRPKTFLLDCSNGELYVGTYNLTIGGMLPCVPKALIKPAENDLAQDGLLLWLEELLRRLQNGMIKTRMLMTSRYISLYPEAPPSWMISKWHYKWHYFSSITFGFFTNGIKVRSSAVFVPEHPGGPGEKFMFTYSIRMSVPEACMLGGVYYSSCQLCSRHWTIRSCDRVVSDVSGGGVIGQYPVLLPGEDEFVYESCTPLPKVPGSVEGSFSFVPGKSIRPEGKPFEDGGTVPS
ncbi:unnamed protein product [Miscanthus lutarioriparius]|uniref:ApaG domain-containing protein n=1 Tax=Miscanthus lutarioriparius TaxID=422564 RepID=A0A811SQS6_9POAL|nr:unnamed protein product [Miscanthus lutarioriparius]